MSLSELKKYTFVAKYPSYDSKLKRRENWVECVDRSERMMLEKYKDKNVDEYIKQAYGAAKRKEALGAQRALQFAGPAILAKNARMYNCSGSYADRPRFFQEEMYLLLCGCGTGFSVQKHHINRLPNLVSKLEGKAKFIVPDTIEGWADAIGVLVNSYFDGGIYPDYEGKNVIFDYSLIRPEGSKLSYTTGKAPGHKPLENALKKIKNLLDLAVQSGQKKLKPIQVYDIVMHSSDAVLAGGVRRSSCICLFSHDDDEMMKAKTGNWFAENPQRGRSNNSVVLIKNKTTFEDFQKIIESVRNFGEPGFAWCYNKEAVFNPCFEIGFWAYFIKDPDKYSKWKEKNEDYELIDCQPSDIGLESGWEFCNLSTINGSKIDSKDKFLKACENAAIIGTLQAGYSDFPYLGNASEQIVRREALLGVSMTGIMEHPEICLDPDIQQEGAAKIKEINEKIAKLIGINPGARLTCIKPEGSTSCVLGTSSGIHPHHAKRYIRRVQANVNEPLYKYFKEYNPSACEPSVWSANQTDDVISFCVEVPDGSKLKNQIGAIELLEYVKSTYKNWVSHGKTKKRCSEDWLSHNVSNTITVKDSEWEEVTKFIYKNREFFCGISILPESGDKDYPQAPFTTVFTHKEMVNHYGESALFVSGLIERGLDLYEDNLWKACDILLGLGEKPRGEAKTIWINKCKSFADKYLNKDIRKLTYLMKDVYNWKLWLDLNREYKDVNYEEFFEEEEKVNINHVADDACAGGTCQIIRT